jgi:hypothetical protein
MDELVRAILSVWPLLLGLIGLVAWLVKVKGQTEQNTTDIAKARAESKEETDRLEARIDARRQEDNNRIEKLLGTMSDDIKKLLQRGG